jgi:hypothetical protein
MAIHLLWCARGGEMRASHDVVQIFVVTIIKGVGFHVSQK